MSDPAEMSTEEHAHWEDRAEVSKLKAENERLKTELQVFVTSYDEWLGRQDIKPDIDLAENARQLLKGAK